MVYGCGIRKGTKMDPGFRFNFFLIFHEKKGLSIVFKMYSLFLILYLWKKIQKYDHDDNSNQKDV